MNAVRQTGGWRLLADKVLGLALEDAFLKTYRSTLRDRAQARLFLCGRPPYTRLLNDWLAMASDKIARECESARDDILAGLSERSKPALSKAERKKRAKAAREEARQRREKRLSERAARDKVLRAHCKTKTARELAAMVGMSHAYVLGRLKKLGLKARPVPKEVRLEGVRRYWKGRKA